MYYNTPYIPCFSINDPSPNIIYGVNDVINLAMDTNHGRVYRYLQLILMQINT
jgi:hypothetical protein